MNRALILNYDVVTWTKRRDERDSGIGGERASNRDVYQNFAIHFDHFVNHFGYTINGFQHAMNIKYTQNNSSC